MRFCNVCHTFNLWLDRLSSESFDSGKLLLLTYAICFSLFNSTLLPVLTCRSTSDAGCRPLSRCTRSSRPPVLRSMCSGYAALLFFSRFVSVSRPLPAQIVSDRRVEAVPGRPSPPSHSYTTRCGRTAYRPMNRHSLVEWLHICSQQFTDLWISVFKILFFRKTVLTIACSDLRDLKKKKSFLRKIPLDVLEILIFAFSDVSICRLTT